MTATRIDAWPSGDGWVVEPRFDGWRACVFRLADRVWVQSRSGRDLARYFPDIVAAARTLPVGSVIDGELVIWNGERTDSTLLRERITGDTGPSPGSEAHLVAFDLLQHPAGVLLDRPLSRRRTQLSSLLAQAPAVFDLVPQAVAGAAAEELMSIWGSAGIESVVVKGARGRYRPGRSGWFTRRIP